MTDWFEMDDFWELMYSRMFGDESWIEIPAQVDQVFNLLDIKPGAVILDLCCGPGRHSLEIARRGHKVIGVDRTAIYLERAKEQMEAENLKIEFVQDDMRTFRREKTFDAALLMYTSFGYFEDPDENQLVLKNIQQSLKVGGTVLIELMGKEILTRSRFCQRDWYEKDGIIFLEERKLSRDGDWTENHWIMLQDQDRHEYNISYWVYSAAELSKILEDNGFSFVNVYGSLDGAPYDRMARSMVIVGKKV